MNVLHARVVHSTTAARFGIQRALEHRTEDGGRDIRPVERGAMVAKNINNLVGKVRNFNVFRRKQSAIHVWERLQFCIVAVAVLNFGI